MTAQEHDKIIDLIKREVVLSIGCTEPMAVSLCVAKACETLGQKPEKIKVTVSANIFKNAMGVGIPNSGMTGLPIAIALGVVAGKSEYGLEVLRDVDAEAVNQAKALLQHSEPAISVADECHGILYIKTVVSAGEESAEAVISGSHTNFSSVKKNGAEVASNEAVGGAVAEAEEVELTLRKVYDFAEEVDIEKIEFIGETAQRNVAAAELSFTGNYGHGLGAMLHSGVAKNIFGDTLFTNILAHTSGACDARMSGAMVPVMSNSGSGNQGITVTMPVIAYSLRYGTSDEQLARALTLSHLIAIHIKGYLGKLSALCGCVIASTGSACGLVYLRGGDYEQICSAIKNMIGNITGMVCDGAKVGCAMKVASGVSCALQSAVLARGGICISEHDGIIEKDIEKTIQNLGRIGSVGMQNTDNMILDIMVCK